MECRLENKLICILIGHMPIVSLEHLLNSIDTKHRHTCKENHPDERGYPRNNGMIGKNPHDRGESKANQNHNANTSQGTEISLCSQSDKAHNTKHNCGYS